MYIIIWEFQVETEQLIDFETAYASNGTWEELFKKSPAYLGTELLRDENDPNRYLAIDRWVSKGDYEAFRSQWKDEYEALDRECEGMTERESLLGIWEPIRS
ncbi:MAG: antibiotic biosynthesis monooxygenase [Chloroflexi bacterium]|nr:antibiotic biosynthesis monooxygenase [Chloroflexota bacterium]